jgi:hypothetical protein
MHATENEINEFRSVIDDKDMNAALGFLNARTSFRYTAIYQLEGSNIRNLWLFDRLGKDTPSLNAGPLTDSFCQFVVSEGEFSMADSASDVRAEGHSKRGIVRSYFGLPLSSAPGTIFGTLCHFDSDPMQIVDSEVSFLESVRPLIMTQLG